VGDRLRKVGQQADMSAVNRVTNRRPSDAAAVRVPAFQVFWVAFKGLADVMTERACNHYIAVNLGSRKNFAKIVDIAERELGDPSQMEILTAALENKRTRRGFSGNISNPPKA
jgi:hypothetical protein